MSYYMLSVSNDDGTKRDNPSIFITEYNDKKRVLSCIQHMRNGGFKDDYRVVQRVSLSEFRCTKTNEFFKIDINNRLAYTFEAWRNFIDPEKYKLNFVYNIEKDSVYHKALIFEGVDFLTNAVDFNGDKLPDMLAVYRKTFDRYQSNKQYQQIKTALINKYKKSL